MLRVTTRLGCVLEPIYELKVIAANGNELRCIKVCKAFSWMMQGQTFQANVLALPLDNYDLVLGILWLVEVGNIIWNFRKLHMKFQVGGKEFILQGTKNSSSEVTVISSEKLDRVRNKTGQISMVQCFKL